MSGPRKRLLVILSGLALGWVLLGTARADVVVVVSAKSPIKTLTRAQLADIYLGRTNRFPDGQTAIPIDQREDSAAHAEFYSDYLGRTETQIREHWAKLIFTGRGQPPRTVADSAAAVHAIAGNPHAIGYVDSRRVDHSVRVVSIE